MFDATEPAENAEIVRAVLIIYAWYSIVVLAALYWGWVRKLSAFVAHSVDLLALSLLTMLTQGISSPFLVVFNFVLVAASLRWSWRGVVATLLLLVLLSGLSVMADMWASRTPESPGQLAIRMGYLFVVSILLGYASAHREYQHQRLVTLARWGPSASVDRAAVLSETLHRAAEVLEAHCAVAMWQIDGGPWETAIWRNGRGQILTPSAQPPIVVPATLAKATFSRVGADPDRLNLIGAKLAQASYALSGDLVTALPIVDYSSAPLEGSNVDGRLFLIGNIRGSDDHLFVTRIVADRVSAELDRQVLSELATERTSFREREAIARDLHDGLLQNLTAARAQLELVQAGGETAGQLQTIRDLLQVEQHRVRRFVEFIRSMEHEQEALEALRPHLEECARTWGCDLSLELAPKSARVSRRQLNDLSLMLTETVANAVRHGEAQSIKVVVRHDAALEVEVHDDGRGFPVATSNWPRDVDPDGLPKSLYSRALDLGGRLRILTSTSGTYVYFELPLQ
ncbi:sensor histidine kinase [Bradyrhizobium erythrophlei]|uniref:sensor histidine kinase n=1 Tax=Bradyrhizobium erythrophlei TaxID=1437360 RepID=UPI0035E99A2D